ncbi:MAG: squalene synthase HpnC [Burkholderiaceae bacterium]
MPASALAGVVTGVDHYENFPVGSLLLPPRLRPAVIAIYRFARHADDLADEGTAAPAQRLAALEQLDDALLALEAGQARGAAATNGGAEPAGPVSPLPPPSTLPPIVAQLQPHLAAHGLPVAPLRALLSAFSQDVVPVRHLDRARLLDYCSRSANPVGELMLRLFGAWNEATRPHSERICSALQLINFLQDVADDWRRDRLYLPLDALRAAGLDERAVASAVTDGRVSPALARVIADQTRQARELLCHGAALVPLVPRRLGWELRAIIAGGLRITERLRDGGYDPVAQRPKLGWRDAPALLRLWRRPSI